MKAMKKMDGPRKDRKQLSWAYRNKKKQGKVVKKESNNNDNVQVQNKKARIIVRNLSFKVTEDDIRKFYSSFGEIEQIDLLRKPDGKLVGCGFIQFKRLEDASKAIFKTNKKEFFGRPITSTWAIEKSKFVEKLQQNENNNEKDQETPTTTEEPSADNDDFIKLDDSDKSKSNFKKPIKIKKKLTTEERKELKLKQRKKRSRIVVRNLSFKADEKTIKEHFQQYGTIEEINMLKKDGKFTGCAFIQFDHVQSARKAVFHANMKPICDRPVIVDLALAKSKFQKKSEIKEEPKDIKEEEIDDSKDTKERDSVSNENVLSDDENEDEDEDDDEETDNDDDDDYDLKSEEDEDQNKNCIKKEDEESEKPRPRVLSHDIPEGKTVFLKNVPFSVKNDELRKCMEQFGPVYYALVCIDSLTEHSKGTAFVKFVNVEDAEKCLSAGTELRLHNQVLDPHRALDRNELANGNSLKSRKIKDSRNLYLVKEGVIMAGSPAAQGVSAADMKKRLELEQWKSQMLRNLTMFVSRVRLIVHNLPPNLEDSTLKTIFLKHAGPKAFITEARIMRHLNNKNSEMNGTSKGFAFVAFTKHEDALRALRMINNNPNIFSKSKRPIVAFSIESKTILNAKERRIKSSREKNPLWKDNKRDYDNKSSDPPVKRLKNNNEEKFEDEDAQKFSGINSKPGAPLKLRAKFKLKEQAFRHREQLKTEKKNKKAKRRIKEMKTNESLSRKEIKPKVGQKKPTIDEANLSKLINNYKDKLTSIPQNKSKWYDS
ncbi:RNA-binding protein 28 isoform X2 [Cotesia glomerata]|uniref:RNA-binding protein 28 isoform X2 n=1 Tax=Cotesia glomerata TaxID=32391 RepID=UPI001D02F4DE|nr:RNA-binding protein 28 isoform X2 [Cotesia glomerata]